MASGEKSWWGRASDNEELERLVFSGLAGAYSLIGAVALVQLVRIQLRVPEYGWTTQKVFHLLNFIVNSVRAVVFIFREEVQAALPHVSACILLDLPGLLFFTTYTLLVLFWAEIYHQAQGLPNDNLRPTFMFINLFIYGLQGAIWGFMYLNPEHVNMADQLSKFLFAGVSVGAAIGFLVYGGRLFLLLRRFPIESRGRRKKLNEVGFVTTICFVCFSVRATMMAFAAVDKAADLDVVNHPILNAIYYSLVELIPSALVLYILRKLPPKRTGTSLAVR